MDQEPRQPNNQAAGIHNILWCCNINNLGKTSKIKQQEQPWNKLCILPRKYMTHHFENTAVKFLQQ